MKPRKTFLLLLSVALLFTFPTTVSAARSVRGKIWGGPGLQALPNVRVVAYDHDYNDLITGNINATGDCDAAIVHAICPGDVHDKMGEDITDANGNYVITYNPPNRWPNAGHWDMSINHQDTRWRPDIYIDVYIPTDGFCEPVQTGKYKWRFAGRSQIFLNWPTDTDLPLNFVVPELFDVSCGTFGPLAPYMNGPPGELRGWVDMHAHPMAHVGFGGKLLHGTPDVGALMPGGTRSCGHLNESYADGTMDVLAHCGPTHMFWLPIDRECGDILRYAFLSIFEEVNEARSSHGAGFPSFQGWAPTWDDLTHQKMWIDWIYRAYRGGQRVMVALAVNNRTLAYVTKGPLVEEYFDKASGDLQIAEMKRMVSRHPFMEIAYSPAQLRNIVSRNKLAVVLGLELDDFGDFHFNSASHAQIRVEIERLHTLGVRYMFPVHLTDNRLGAPAVYQSFFNVANVIQTGKYWTLTNAPGLGYCFEDLRPEYTNIVTYLNLVLDTLPFGLGAEFRNAALGGLSAADRQNPRKVLEAYGRYILQVQILLPDGEACVEGSGHVNANGLTAWGETAINHMMALGMMIDIDHMSRRTVEDVIVLTEPSDYPLNSGHNACMTSDVPLEDLHENNRTWEQYDKIAARGGMVGVGTAGHIGEFMKMYTNTVAAMQTGNPANRSPGLGTDINGMFRPPRPPGSAGIPNLNYAGLPRARTGEVEWDYNIHGVAHYGILPDYLVHVGQRPGGANVLSSVFGSAEAFARMWEKSVAACIALSKPAAVSPACGAMVTSTTPVFQWSSVPNHTGYIVRIFAGGTCSGTPLHTSSKLPVNTTSYAVPGSVGLLSGETYSWQIQAKGDGINYCDSPWSTCCSLVVSPFLAAAGLYHGLFYDTNKGVLPESSGFLKLNLGKSRFFTGYVHSVPACGSVSFNGTFDATSKIANVQLPPPLGALMTLELKASQSFKQIVGTITASGWQAHLEADQRRSTPPAGNIQGRYTLIIPADPLSQSGPDGDGYGTLSLGTDGQANFSGITADNRGLKQVVPISANGDWPLFVCLYGGGGSLTAWMKFSPKWRLANDGASWTRPTMTAALYPAGFSNHTVIAGSRYVPPAPLKRVLNFGDGKVVFSGGNLPANVTNLVWLGTNNTVLNRSTNPLSMTINTNLGTFQGSFKAPGDPKAYKFRGAVLQNSNAGWGHFLGTNESGRVYFGPRR
jgi:microsomal dipeptidase-like Zn-dependent dipeptidase